MSDTLLKPKLLRVKDAATYLGLGERTVRELVGAGVLARRYIGPRQFRITVESCDAYVDALPQEAPRD